MNIKHIAIITLAALSLTSLGCSDKQQLEESQVIERATADDSVLTSTAAAPEPVEAKAPQPEVKAPEPEAEADKPTVIETPKEEPKLDEPATEPVVESVDGVTLQRFVTTSDIVEREPVAAASTFTNDVERVYAFIDASNESTSAKSLMVHFIGPEGKVSGGIELIIPASVPRWRTWAYTRHAKKTGLWRVEIRGVDGSLIGALPFEVEPGL